MMNKYILFLTHSIFNYLNRFGLGNSNLNQVWEAFSPSTTEATNIPSTLTLGKIMESWINQKGCPYISAIRNYDEDVLVVRQEASVPLEETIRPRKECWVVPLSYTTEKELKFVNVEVRQWLNCNDPLKIELPGLRDNEWILLNIKLNVLARVNYDRNNWMLLQNTLLDGMNYLNIEVLTRVKLVSDLFALAEAEKLPVTYGFVFDSMKYLSHETFDSPRKVALDEFYKIRKLFFRTRLLQPFQNYVRDILESIFKYPEYNDLYSFASEVNTDHQFEMLIIEAACTFGVGSCKEQSKELLQNKWNHGFDTNHVIPPNINLFKIIQCEGVKHGNEEHWNFIWNQYPRMKSTSLGTDILEVLACSSDEKILDKYLEMSMDKNIVSKEDGLTVFRSLSSNEKGYELMKTFLEKNFSTLYDGDAENALTYLTILLDVTTKKKDYDKLLRLIHSKKLLPPNDKIVQRSSKKATQNIKWYKKHKHSLRKYFNVGIFNKASSFLFN